jgi:hypothetical protein
MSLTVAVRRLGLLHRATVVKEWQLKSGDDRWAALAGTEPLEHTRSAALAPGTQEISGPVCPGMW